MLLRWTTYICLLALLAGCGYYNPYVAASDAEPITLHHSLWRNNTNELGLESVLDQSLSSWLRRSNSINLVDSLDQAQYRLTGAITSVNYNEISYGSNNDATELRAILRVEIKIIDQNDAIVWENKTMYDETLLKDDSNPASLQSNKRQALHEITDEVAEDIYLYIVNTLMRK